MPIADDHPLFILRKLRAHRRMQAVMPPATRNWQLIVARLVPTLGAAI